MKKINFKRLTALSLLIVMLFTMIACTPAGPAETTPESTTEAPVTEAPEVLVDIVKDQKTEYVIVFLSPASKTVCCSVAVLQL